MTSSEHQPNDITRAEVSALTSFGNTQEQIADYLEIDSKTLRKHYRKELDNSIMLANAQVAKRLYHKATVQDDLSAMIFWLKTRAKWREKDRDDTDDQKTLAELLINAIEAKK